MEFHKMIALSTAHLAVDTRELMQRLEGTSTIFETGLPVYYAKNEYGWFVYVSDITENLPGNSPVDLRNCIHLARSRECGWIMFDRDVDPIKELPTFED